MGAAAAATRSGSELRENQRRLSSYLDASGAQAEERELRSPVLGAHLVSYPKEVQDGKADLNPFVIQTGQLMGSPLSFPILCSINVASYRATLAEYMGRDMEMNDLPVLLNGDDICFMANDVFYALWKKWITRAGFTLSLGKNYISPNYVTINSQGFLWSGGSSFKQLPAFSTGLLLEHAETGKVTAMRSGIRQQPEASKWTEVLRSAHVFRYIIV